jgi:hypothetical protein
VLRGQLLLLLPPLRWRGLLLVLHQSIKLLHVLPIHAVLRGHELLELAALRLRRAAGGGRRREVGVRGRVRQAATAAAPQQAGERAGARQVRARRLGP